MVSREDILARGKGEIRVFRAGMYQREEFVVKRIDSPFGTFAVLEVDKFIDLKELLRVAEEYRLPVYAKNGKVFPKGKSTKDFVGL
ncbi:MAG: hypothetical protein ABIF01_00705 [Candidatus Micrarchaeota archaeon]